MPDYSDDEIRSFWQGVRTIALVGASNKPERPSHGVMRFLQRSGYRVIPVNPGLAGGALLGETVYARLGDIPLKVDLIDVFRRSEEAGALVDDAIKLGVNKVWMQLDVIDPQAAARGKAAGVAVIMDRCPAIELPRLGMTPL